MQWDKPDWTGLPVLVYFFLKGPKNFIRSQCWKEFFLNTTKKNFIRFSEGFKFIVSNYWTTGNAKRSLVPARAACCWLQSAQDDTACGVRALCRSRSKKDYSSWMRHWKGVVEEEVGRSGFSAIRGAGHSIPSHPVSHRPDDENSGALNIYRSLSQHSRPNDAHFFFSPANSRSRPKVRALIRSIETLTVFDTVGHSSCQTFLRLIIIFKIERGF